MHLKDMYIADKDAYVLHIALMIVQHIHINTVHSTRITDHINIRNIGMIEYVYIAHM